MKYKYMHQPIPQDRRRELNDKILYLIDNDLAEASGISCEDIYNAYTGDGGLHGLHAKDYDNYHSYSEAKKEIENGQFFTPHDVCKVIMDCVDVQDMEVVADLTCGMGTFFNFVREESNIYGCELDIKAYKVAKYLYPKANLTCGDIRSFQPGIDMDYIVGNPPFNLTWWVDGEKVLSQLYYCRKAAELLKPLGIMALVVPRSFLADDFTDGAMIRELEEKFSFLGQFALDSDTFAHVGVHGYDTKVQFWQKRSDLNGFAAKPYTTKVDSVGLLDGTVVEYVRETFLNDAQELMRKNKAHVARELAARHAASDDFNYKVQKYLWHIKSHPRLREKYVKCCEYLNRFLTQQRPEGMSYEEWMRVRITEAKVLSYLRNTVRKQHPVEHKDEIRLVKRDYSIGYKAYSPKMARQIDEELNAWPIHRIVSADMDPAGFGPYARLLRRRKKEYDIEQQQFSEMTMDTEIARWLDDFHPYDSVNDELITLRGLQKEDLNKVLQKRYMLLQWKQGCGKTLAGIATGLYRMERQNAFCTWVVSPAISIRNNWSEVIPVYGYRHIVVDKLSDLENIRKGDFVLITTNKLRTYHKQIKKWMRMHGQNVAFCFDESDEMTNPSSAITKAVLDVFRHARFKLLMTGTSTRNNVGEFAPQLEMLYNNSANMISWCEKIYHEDKENTDEYGRPQLVCEPNPYYGKPIPAYKRGVSLFLASHGPERITVFGAGKRDQNIYNADELTKILGRLVITRSFEEITGRDLIRPQQVTVTFTDAERTVYQKAIREFELMRSKYYASTGNARKDSMMKLVQQLNLLLRISAAPNSVEEYEGETPTKILKVLEMLGELNDQIVAIGVRHKMVAEIYAQAIRAAMPDRPLFIVTGATTTLAQRRKLKKTLQGSGNGILLCTQQSLPSSVNFEYVDHIFLPELYFNDAKMSQFYFRFIRYTSKNVKNVYFITYLGSIESNQMQMAMAKEKINLFMKGKDADLDEIYTRYGVDYDLMSALMSREKDENGAFHIRWGEQEIA